jgi:alpha-1,3-glucosyltransferase
MRQKTSEWTLDYPPFFAYFEWLLSQIAVLFDPEMLKVNNLEYTSIETIAFQRLSVFLTDLFFFWSVYKYLSTFLSNKRFYKSSNHSSPDFAKAIFLSLIFCPAFLILDHIHFQYNGPLFAILVFSLYEAQTSPLISAFSFSTLLCLKHIYLYLAPAYFFYLLRSYCLSPTWRPQMLNIIKLGCVVLTPLVLAFGPFIALGQGDVLLKRLFPFLRGLCHAYWAPNFWALYSFADRLAIQGTLLQTN